MNNLPKVGIFGAGCIGCYIGGWLSKAYSQSPERLIMIGRDSLAERLRDGLKVSDYNDNSFFTPSVNLVNSLTAPTSNSDTTVDILLVTVKCTAVSNIVKQLSPFVNDNTVIICLQNGIGSETAIKEHYNANEVVCGVVGFNALAIAPGHYHRGTSGDIIIEDIKNEQVKILVDVCNQVHLETSLTNNIEAVRWGKLLLNLNNAINAVAGIPLKEELSDRKFRLVLSLAMSELLSALKKAQITPEQFTAVSPQLLLFILKLPNMLFKILATKMLAIDPLARSSMWHDIDNGVLTEIDYINGAVISLAKKHGISTPINQKIVEIIHLVQSKKTGSPKIRSKDLYHQVTST